jgi:hypothetical protein
MPPASYVRNIFMHMEKLLLDAGGITGTAKQLPMLIYSIFEGGYINETVVPL